MYKKRLLIPAVFVSFVLLLTLVSLLNIGYHGIASGEIGSDAELRGLESLSAAFIRVSKDVKPSVVNISTTQIVRKSKRGSRSQRDYWDPFREFFGDEFFKRFEEQQNRPRRSLGSGVIVSEDGYILTNNHVIADADEIKVTLEDKREFDAKLIGTDKDSEVAVIKIDAKNLPAATLGNSDKLQVGEWVLAIGNPLRLSHTVTAGIISATGRSYVGLANYEDFIQTDAAINPGNSGGPLVNIKGEVIGINTAIATAAGIPGNIGIGFTIPINMAHDVMDQLIKTGRVVRGWLGIQLQEVNIDLAEKYGLMEPRGVLISESHGPAKKAGLETGDLIIEFNGESVENGSHLKMMVAAIKPGETVEVKAIRGGKEKKSKVKLGERTTEAMAELGGSGMIPDEEEEGREWMGMTVQELTDELAQRLGYEDQNGVLISDVDSNGPAALIDNPPKSGDLIQEIELKEIKNMKDFTRAIKNLDDPKKVMIRLRRAATGMSWYVVVKEK